MLLCVDDVVVVDLLSVDRGLDGGGVGRSRQETLTFDGADFILFMYCLWLYSILPQLVLLGVGISEATSEQHGGELEFGRAVISVISVTWGVAVR